MAARLFDDVEETPQTASFGAVARTMYYVDLSAAAADVVCTLPAGTTEGECIGLEVTDDAATWSVTYAGPVSADVPPLSARGDWVLLTWTGAAWALVGVDTRPGWFDTAGGTVPAAALYRFNTIATNTDFSGLGNTLTMQSSLVYYRGYRAGVFSVRRNVSGAIATCNNAGVRLSGAMTALLLWQPFAATGGCSLVQCGVGTGGAANNALYGFGFDGSNRMQYVQQTGANVTASFVETGAAALNAGWHVHGFTRSATGVVTLYWNGRAMSSSAALGLPNNGGSAVLGIGANNDNTFPANNASYAQLGLWPSAMTPAQVLRQTRQALGRMAA